MKRRREQPVLRGANRKTRVPLFRERWAGLALLLILLLSACGLPWDQPTPSPVPTLQPTAVPTVTPTATPAPSLTPMPIATPVPSRTSVPTPTPLPPPPPTDEPVPDDLYITTESITFYPAPQLYSGDVVSFDVLPLNLGTIDPGAIGVRVYRQTPGGSEIVAETTVGYVTFDEIPRGRMTWAWDTAGLQGEETLTFWIDPEDLVQEGDEDQTNNVVTITVPLLPAAERPEVERQAEWRSLTTDCCILHYVSGTSAERDLDALLVLSEDAVNYSEERLNAQLEEPLEVYFINRIIGHGGYARQHLVLSYLDRHYPGAHLELTIRHEATHVLDALALTSWSPSLLREGLAVWVTGGHFKLEPIVPRASALLELDWYIPLEELAVNFYPSQHEIGYLEGAAFVEYLVQTYGWDAFIEFYKRFDDTAYETPVEAIDAVLQESFGVSFEETEQSFLDWLRANPPSLGHIRDVEGTVYYYDTVRYYQSVYDPTAWFMITWLPNPVIGKDRSIEADFLRHPRAPENIALETMLIAAREAQLAGDFDEAEGLLDVVNYVVDTGIFEDTIAAEYLAIVETAAAVGYEVQQIDLAGTAAHVWAITDWPTLAELDLQRTGSEWVLSD